MVMLFPDFDYMQIYIITKRSNFKERTKEKKKMEKTRWKERRKGEEL